MHFLQKGCIPSALYFRAKQDRYRIRKFSLKEMRSKRKGYVKNRINSGLQ